jgi:hypothetical protein
MSQLKVFTVSVDMNDKEIDKMIKEMNFINSTEDGPSVLTIDGYCKDPRPLWQIKEVVEFAKKIVAKGVCCELVTSTHIKEVMPEGTDENYMLNSLGGIEIWLLSKGYKLENVLITIGIMREFVEDFKENQTEYKRILKTK